MIPITNADEVPVLISRTYKNLCERGMMNKVRTYINLCHY